METQGKFIISLDFELYWGIFDIADIKDKLGYFENTLKVLPNILQLFDKYRIRATWASVGFLFYKDLEEFIKHQPKRLPNYDNKRLSAYKYMQSDYDKKYKKYHFAPDIIKMIAQIPGQEVASHTLSHYYCLEKGQNIQDFEDDIVTHIKIANDFGINLKSLVFPRNQYNQAYEKVLIKHGIKNIRTNPDIWFWDTTKPETIWKKIFRTADAYFPLSDMLFEIPTLSGGILQIPASRFFRPTQGCKVLNELRLKRIKNEMKKAAKENKIYHLWWHPHNFGVHPKESLLDLENILLHYESLNKEYNFLSQNMNDITNIYC